MNLNRQESYLHRERRKFPRLKDNVFIFYRLEGSRKIIENVTKDLSAGGLMFETDKLVSTSATLELEVYMPLNFDKTIISSIFIGARIVWTDEIKEGSSLKGSNKYKAGVELVQVRKEDKIRIIDYVNRKISIVISTSGENT